MSVKVSSVRRGETHLPAARQARLYERRRARRRRILIALVILLVILMGAALYGLEQPGVRISHIEVFGTEAPLSDIALRALQGRYLGIVPRDSYFFFSGGDIRAAVLSQYPDIAAISLFRSGPTSLSLRVTNRVPIARWCGSTYPSRVASTSPTNCYAFDDSGFIFAATTTIPFVNSFIFYEPMSDVLIGATLPNAESFPAAFNFARQLATLGTPVSAVAIRGSEVDQYLISGTRITYVLGDEEDAYTALISARSNLNLTDGSLSYVDLRFDGKVYLKKKNDSVPK